MFLKKQDTFCVLGVTAQYDLWPGGDSELDFICGLARGNGAGVISLMRFDPDFPGNLIDDRVKRACHTLAHEVSHMFGLKHCIYYECLMNGSTGYQEA